jgi:hypothetical protein
MPHGLHPAFAQIYRVLKPGSYCVSFYGWNRVDRFVAAWSAAGFRIVGHLVFRKRYASGGKLLRYSHECAYLLAKGNVMPPSSANRRCHRLEVHRQPLASDAEAGEFIAAVGRCILPPLAGWCLIRSADPVRRWLRPGNLTAAISALRSTCVHHNTAQKRLTRAALPAAA